jgi:acyl carrier protein
MNEKLTNAFCSALNIAPEQVTDELSYQGIQQWDSVAHMALVAELEAAFNVMLDTDDIIAMSSVGVAKQILGKYGVGF